MLHSYNKLYSSINNLNINRFSKFISNVCETIFYFTSTILGLLVILLLFFFFSVLL